MSKFNGIGIAGIFAVVIAFTAAWGTHVIYCLNTAKYVLLIAGGIVPPVGVIHGIGIWFGHPW